jgi:hypothetical protein
MQGFNFDKEKLDRFLDIDLVCQVCPVVYQMIGFDY